MHVSEAAACDGQVYDICVESSTTEIMENICPLFQDGTNN